TIYCLLTALLGTLGCGQPSAAQSQELSTRPLSPHSGHAGPLVSGELISLTLWDTPVGTSGSNSGGSPPEGSRVEVYEEFIIVTDSNGDSQLSLHGWYTNLRFRRD